MQQELALASSLGLKIRTEFVGFDVELVNPNLVVYDPTIGIGEIGSSVEKALDFTSRQNQSCLEFFEDVVIEPSLSVLNCLRSRGFLLGFGLRHPPKFTLWEQIGTNLGNF